MKHSVIEWRSWILGLLLFATTPSVAFAEDYQVGYVVGDGKNGRVFRQWVQQVAETPIRRVSMTLRRHSGGKDTFVNLRFGRGDTFEGGKRIYLNGNDAQAVSWEVGNAVPRGEPLVLNAYNGEVYLERVRVEFAQGGATPRPRQPVTPDFEPRTPFGSTTPRPSRDDRQALARCRNMYIAPPRIDLGELRPTGSLFSGKYKVEGSIRGVCIAEAGYFENGRLRESVEIPLSDLFSRREFKFKVQSGRRGEIRVTTIDGQENFIDIDSAIGRQSQPLF